MQVGSPCPSYVRLMAMAGECSLLGHVTQTQVQQAAGVNPLVAWPNNQMFYLVWPEKGSMRAERRPGKSIE